MSDAGTLRRAIVAALPESVAGEDATISLHSLYIPQTHIKALRLETSLVVGARGVGKSFWTAALSSSKVASFVHQALPDMASVEVHVGHAVHSGGSDYPGSKIFESLVKSGYSSFDIWMAVVLRWLSSFVKEPLPQDDWKATVEWVTNNPESMYRIMEAANKNFQKVDKKGLIIFDALDRTSVSWEIIDTLTSGLLQVVLCIRSYSSLSGKIFLREDQFSRMSFAFPDASKLLAARAELTWQPNDLYGLLWQLFCNAHDDYGEILRNLYTEILQEEPQRVHDVWQLTPSAKAQGEKQKNLFHALTGPWMGKDKRRGIPYIWTVGHLADSRQQTSPRSFLAAVKAAAQDSIAKYNNYIYALHYDSIKRGVQEASKIRVWEMAEDNPWVKVLFAPLEGLVVPCPFAVVRACWERAFPTGLATLARDPENRIPSECLEASWENIKETLESLGLCSTMKDGRINMPDLYRVGFCLGRKGGVKPMGRA